MGDPVFADHERVTKHWGHARQHIHASLASAPKQTQSYLRQ